MNTFPVIFAYDTYRDYIYSNSRDKTCLPPFNELPGYVRSAWVAAINTTEKRETKMNNCDALGLIREARAILKDEAVTANSRELSMVITKLDEAELWRQRDMQLKTVANNCYSTL